MYEVMGPPPFEVGAVQAMAPDPAPAVAEVSDGADGTAVAVVEVVVVNDIGYDAGEVPVVLVAVTEAA
jgi:hypothetical protein